MMWVEDNGNTCKANKEIEAEIKHYNKDLNEPNQIVIGHFGDDGFYFSEGGELSFNWDIVKWRYVD